MAYIRRRGCTCKKNCTCGKKKCTCKKVKCTCGAKFSFTIDIGMDPETGKRKQKTVSGFDTQGEAKDAAAKMHVEIREGIYVEGKGDLFPDLSKKWFEHYKGSGKRKISTIETRESMMQHLDNAFRFAKAADITTDDYEAALKKMKTEGYSKNTISNTHTIGKMIFKWAFAKKLRRDDPTATAELPEFSITVDDLEKGSLKDLYMEKEELTQFLKAAKQSSRQLDYYLFLTLAYTGMRSGELCALKWTDIDFKEYTISITKTIYRRQKVTDYSLLTPKTKKSRRVIEVDSIVIDAIEALQARQREMKMFYRKTYVDEGFVFAKESKKYSGLPHNPQYVHGRMWRLLRDANMVKHLTPHSLRHTHVSLLAEAGATLEEIMERLGHENDRTTKNIYMHITKPMKKRTAQKFTALMNGVK